ncbi:hypothetical protein MUK42_30973 [Musa troglodytarum]|uniref:Uncharacterized protein n=1 Tax=Musa troglodytarum TaxID=320322 RepID=A0A9E7K1J4_9LILI|nr:hypothetical protein MUK42_30973 [Musa troglodytarum]
MPIKFWIENILIIEFFIFVLETIVILRTKPIYMPVPKLIKILRLIKKKFLIGRE